MFQKGILFAICGFLASTAIGATEYYTWVDENGVTNYAQRSPQGYDAELVGSARPFGYPRESGRPQEQQQGSASTESTTSDESDDDFSIEEQRRAIDEQIAEVKRTNCEMGKRNLAQLEAFRRIRVRDEDGQERMLNEEEKAQRINESRQIIRENCRG